MKTKLSPAVVGVFVLGAFAIGIIALLALGSLSILSKPERFMVYFDEAISGLDEGSPVKLRGVRVGHVVAISIRYDRVTGKSVAAVVCELNRGSISDEAGAILDVSDRAALQALVDRGMRAQLEISGLATGLLFVELEFMDPRGPGPAMYAPHLAFGSAGLSVGANETIRPKAGRLVMFPAWLLHQVRPYRGKAERISIAFNLSL